MIKKIIGVILIITGCLIGGMLITSGRLFPHILGPIILLGLGIILIVLNKRRTISNRNTQAQ